MVEGELDSEVELEALLGQQRVLEDQVQLATLRVLLSGQAKAVTERRRPRVPGRPPHGLGCLAVDGAHVAWRPWASPSRS